ncbi:MAG: DUF4388 domain-containing protein, partial [Planctomycetota bacterium]
MTDVVGMEPTKTADAQSLSPLQSACGSMSELTATVRDLLNGTIQHSGLQHDDQKSLERLVPDLEELVSDIRRSLHGNTVQSATPRPTEPVPVDKRTLAAASRRNAFGRALAEELCAVAGIKNNTEPKSPQATMAPSSNDSRATQPPTRVRDTKAQRATLNQAGLSPMRGAGPWSRDELLPSLLNDLGSGHSIQGTSSSLPIDAVFQFLSRTRKTGCLAIRIPERTLRFVIVEGSIVFTVSDPTLDSERLGKLLVETGAIRLHELADFLSEHAVSSKNPLGAELVESGLIEEDALATALARQARDRANAAQSAPHAAYAFFPGTGEAIDEFHADILELMLEAARARDERAL